MRSLAPAMLVALLMAAVSDRCLHAGEPESKAIPLRQLGGEVEKRFPSEESAIVPATHGASLRAIMQDLEGEVTAQGLWLSSTAEEDAGQPNRFRIRATDVAREWSAEGASRSMGLPDAGAVRTGNDKVSYVRPGLVEEYRVSTDGVRQDFVVLQRLQGDGPLLVSLDATGARAEAAPYGAKLTVAATGRELAYSRLLVTDAKGRELRARMHVTAPDRLAVEVDDETAVYPVRIDPTFSDADWIAMGVEALGVDSTVSAIARDTAGNLYIAGEFFTSGDTVLDRVARWNGSTWVPMGTGMNGPVRALAAIGTTLYAGGLFTEAGGNTAIGIARWNGSAWSDVGGGVSDFVTCLSASGSTLYVGGFFSTVGGSVPAQNVARWNGTTWSALGDGVDGAVSAITASGATVYVGGTFSSAGSVAASNIARWTGTTWTAMGDGTDGSVNAIALFGGFVYAGGSFTQAGTVAAGGIARWNGTTWSTVGVGTNEGLDGNVNALAVSGTTLIVAGQFTQAGTITANNIARWNGAAWSALGAGISSEVKALAVNGGTIYAGGSFSMAGTVNANNVASWNGTAWSSMGSGLDGKVLAFAVSGTNLYAGGEFTLAGDTTVNYIARWNGSMWTALGTGMDNHVNALAVIGTDLYAGGLFTTAGGVSANGVARWNGSVWSPLGLGVNGSVECLAVIGSELYVGGLFSQADGNLANNVAKWTNSTSTWSALGSGTDGAVLTLAANGGTLYAGGAFLNAGGNLVNRIAQWSGGAWSALGTGMDGNVRALAIAGSQVYAGGDFTTAGGVTADSIARWDGANWFEVGSGLDVAGITALAAVGNEIYAGGNIPAAGGSGTNYIARWNGSAWSPLGSGVNEAVEALLLNGVDLYAGGAFTAAGGKAASYAARARVAFPLVAQGNAALIVNATSATVHGTVNPRGTVTTVVVEYGPDTNYGSTAPVTFSSTNANTNVNLTKTLTGLTGGITYHYRFKATNTVGTSYSGDATFFIPGGTLAIDLPVGSTIVVEETAGSVEIPIIRTGSTAGTVSVNLSTTNGTAVAPSDYTAQVNVPVNFADGVTSLDVPIPIFNPPNTSEANETFTVKLSGGFVTPGAASSVLVRILDSVDPTLPPAPIITTPAASSLVGVNVGGNLTVTGTASDNKGIGSVKVKINSGPFEDATLTALGAASTPYSIAIAGAVSGTNTVTVQSFDSRGNASPLATRSFTVTRPLTVAVNDGSLGIVTAGFAGATFREVGKSFTITATPKPPGVPVGFAGAIFAGWTVSGGPTLPQLGIVASALEKQTLTFIFREGLQLTANFVENPFPPMAGVYDGLIRPSDTLPDRSPAGPGTEDGTTRTNATEGRITATVSSLGAFSATLTIDGLILRAAGAFDQNGIARFGTARLTTLNVARPGKPSLAVALSIDMTTPGDHDRITGTITTRSFQQSVITDVSEVTADRAFYKTTTPTLDPYYLGATPNISGTFTLIFPPKDEGDQTPGYTALDYPRGYGTGTMTVTKAGAISVTGTLADGTTISLATSLSQDNDFPLFVPLYNRLGFISGQVQLNKNEADSDLSAADLQWLRPFQVTHYYPAGWPDCITVDLLGAKYAAVAGQSILKSASGGALQAPDEDGNASLSFMEGALSETLIKAANVSTADVVTKVPSNDPTFTVTITRTTGAFSGVFDHTDDTKPAYNGVFFQKGANAGGYGFFLTKQPVPINYTGESGGVLILGAP